MGIFAVLTIGKVDCKMTISSVEKKGRMFFMIARNMLYTYSELLMVSIL